MDKQYKVIGFRDDMYDVNQWREYNSTHAPITYREYLKRVTGWMNGENIHPNDEKTA